METLPNLSSLLSPTEEGSVTEMPAQETTEPVEAPLTPTLTPPEQEVQV